MTPFFLLSILSILPLTTSIPATTISSASEILSNSNHNAFSLLLPLLSTPLSLPSLSSSTLFSVPDTAFSSSSSSCQPSLSTLKLHFSPKLLSPSDLLSLPYGSRFPTLHPNSSLVITSSIFDDFVAINGLKLDNIDSPLYTDSSFVVYSVSAFFSPSYFSGYTGIVSQLSPGPSYPNSGCQLTVPTGVYWEAAAALRTRGYSRMAGFLDVQVSQFDNDDKDVITVFAPMDEAMEGYLGGNYSDWGSVFLRHVVGCEMSWGDLVGLNDGAVLGTFLRGFGIQVDKNNSGYLVLNQNFTVDFPDFYRGDRVLVHGLSGVFTVPDENKKAADREVAHGGSYTPSVDKKTVSDHGEF